MISYKLYDSEEYMITSGDIYLDSFDQGDKLQDDSIVNYDIIPGKTYRLILCKYDWYIINSLIKSQVKNNLKYC